MPEFAVSNIALSAYDHEEELLRLPELGLQGLEVAPSRVWRDTWQGLTPREVETYRQTVERAGLKIVGLHSLFFDHPELGLFKDPETRVRTLDYLVHLSGLCRDLGGRTMIYGGGRHRGEVAIDKANTETIDFCHQLCSRIEDHGTCLCFEPLGPNDSDFINSAYDALEIVDIVNHPSLRSQLDAKALVENDEVTIDLFRAAKSTITHFHANEPGLNVLGQTGQIDHAFFGASLRDIGYNGYVSIEQRMLNQENPLSDLEASVAVLKECYS
jgi:sugar phosphate isomerase/epimerase